MHTLIDRLVIMFLQNFLSKPFISLFPPKEKSGVQHAENFS